MAELINAGDPLAEDFPMGPDVGEIVPDFELTDARGQLVRFTNRPPKTRALILFYRSASW
ncbi:MAG TPA: hypothetical protein EYQ31_11670 [Candidatus Handelsmanbacteria bacterium]|nr:hypothetical protein [Candidatus Handelsmanbacteria bacterium]